MVMAYRFKLEIERRPIVCAKRNDYFLWQWMSRQSDRHNSWLGWTVIRLRWSESLEEDDPLDWAICQNQALRSLIKETIDADTE